MSEITGKAEKKANTRYLQGQMDEKEKKYKHTPEQIVESSSSQRNQQIEAL